MCVRGTRVSVQRPKLQTVALWCGSLRRGTSVGLAVPGNGPWAVAHSGSSPAAWMHAVVCRTRRRDSGVYVPKPVVQPPEPRLSPWHVLLQGGGISLRAAGARRLRKGTCTDTPARGRVHTWRADLSSARVCDRCLLHSPRAAGLLPHPADCTAKGTLHACRSAPGMAVTHGWEASPHPARPAAGWHP
ncbi:hypothetical protein HJG60_012292 [Phyllostomus discolor]|uniref:Uncharacterized protein n=1 Tax=Phyllostomus discolor TaxID=89673 RepID=A0A833ZDR7_9CHIR|nr:hypothetical protein HJG60_012292 [Phyllostomus discolor]